MAALLYLSVFLVRVCVCVCCGGGVGWGELLVDLIVSVPKFFYLPCVNVPKDNVLTQ